MTENIIKVSGLSKMYRNGTEAVKNISFEVKSGEFFAFLGPNGAGKSTTIKILTTLIRASSGTVEIAGYNLEKQSSKIRLNIGTALQNTAIDPVLTGREMLMLQARLFGFSKQEGSKRAEELIKKFDLKEVSDRACGKYSGGMKRRLDLAISLVHHPKILFLDEPTVGLDPISRIKLWEEINLLNKEYGTTIFLTTQYLEEADKMADKIAIIKNGELAAFGNPSSLKEAIDKNKTDYRNTTLEDVFFEVVTK